MWIAKLNHLSGEQATLSHDSRLNGICMALDCQPGDLLEYIPDDGKVSSIVNVVS